jgi:hypothetical protein
MPSYLTPLRWIALLGPCFVLLVDAVQMTRMQARQAAGFLVLILAVIAVALFIALLTPSAMRRMIQHKDIFVPLSLLVLAERMVTWLALLPLLGTMMKFSTPAALMGLIPSLSILFLLHIFLAVAFAAWTTAMVVQIVATGRCDLLEGIAAAKRGFLRVFGFEFIGWAVTMSWLVFALLFMRVAMPFALLLVAVGTVLWNFATAALLPHAFLGAPDFGSALREGFRVSWAGVGRWWGLLILQMLLLGFVIFYSLHTSERPGHYSHNISWSVNAFWIGGYHNECHWYSKLMSAFNAPKLDFVSTLLGLLFSVLAIALKLTIVERFLPPPPAASEAPAVPPVL